MEKNFFIYSWLKILLSFIFKWKKEDEMNLKVVKRENCYVNLIFM